MKKKSKKALMYWNALFQKEEHSQPEQTSVFPDSELDLDDIQEGPQKRGESQKKQGFSQSMDQSKVQTPSSEQSTELGQARQTTSLLKKVFAPSEKGRITGKDYAAWQRNKLEWQSHLEELGEVVSGFGKRGGIEPSTGFRLMESELNSILHDLETKLVKKMDLSELLSDDKLAEQITPQMGIVHTLLLQKNRLKGKALTNAKRLIKRYVDQMANLFKPMVDRSIVKIRDPDVVPKRIYQNLDIKRTVWANLPNWDPEEEKLYVNRLYFYRASKKALPTKLIVVVDQSGSMVTAMVQTTILASIFAGLPNVNVELLAFDTKVVDLSRYAKDPFEVLLQTRLGGGTHINLALLEAKKRIIEPKRTGIVLITDYYEGGNYDRLFATIKSIKEGGSSFVSVVSMEHGGNVNANQQFIHRLKKSLEIGSIQGGVDDLIAEIADIL